MKNTILAILITILVGPRAYSQVNPKLAGGDISLLPRYELYNTPYYTETGAKIDNLILYLRDAAGWNAIRVRLFVNPNPNEAKDGVVQDLDYVTDLGKRIKEAGLKFMLDFHYSDSWADPSNQKTPAAWNDCKTPEQKAKRLYEYTQDCLNTLTQAGAKPDYVQVGNEISYGILDIKVHPYDQSGDDWEGFLQVLEQGCKAVRECCPEAQIIIHTERAAKANDTEYFYRKLALLDYDIIGLSYYPIWHAPLNTLNSTIDQLAQSFPEKQVQIVETAYNYEWWPSSGVSYDTRSIWPCSIEGQQKFAQDLVTALNTHPNVTGVYWWFPEENGNGGASWNASTIVISKWLDRGLWNNNDHKALPALYELRYFRSDEEAICNIPEDDNNRQAIYRLDGTPIRQEWTTLPHGIYIMGGRKVAK